MSEYSKPEIEIIEIKVEDITTSAGLVESKFSVYGTLGEASANVVNY